MSDKLNNMFDDINESDKDRTRALGKLVKKKEQQNETTYPKYGEEGSNFPCQ